jgi:hypothetical protein
MFLGNSGAVVVPMYLLESGLADRDIRLPDLPLQATVANKNRHKSNMDETVDNRISIFLKLTNFGKINLYYSSRNFKSIF